MVEPRRFARPLLPALAAAWCACHAGERNAARALVRDSAGIRIVESPAPLGPQHLPWTLDTVPLLDLGSREDDLHEQFSGFLLPLRLSNGQIVVATGASSELRYFDGAGTWLHNIGRSGQGPGEFEALGWVGLGPGDTLRTYDWSLRRLSVFSPTGRFVRSIILTSPGRERGAVPLSPLAAGELLASSTPFVVPGAASGVTRDTAPLLIYGEAGTPVDSFGNFPGSEALIEGTEKSVTVMGCPFGKRLAYATSAGHDAVYVGSEDGPEISMWTAQGRLTRILRWQAPGAPVTEQDRLAYVQSLSERAQPGQEEFQNRLIHMVQKANLPARKPAYAGLLAGPRGTLWVQAYTAPDLSRPVPYQVFDSTGQWLSELTLPPRFTATQIGEDFVLGSWKDEDDVDHVRLYRLVARPAS